MDHSSKIKQLQDYITQLNGLKELAYKISDCVYDIEQSVGRIDESLPNPEFIGQIADKTEREQISHAENLLREAYGLIDEMLGPPDEDQQDGVQGEVRSEEKDEHTVSFEEMMKLFHSGNGGKGSAS